MTLQPVKASGWLATELSKEERIILSKNGIVPINDIFFDSWEVRDQIQFYYGGRGGGKSVFIFQKLINQCRNDEYFKCFYGRKIFDTIRESCFATLVASIEDMGLKQEFRYSNTKNGSMVVTHIPTGNQFIPFGADNAKKLKSIKDPTVVYCEEFEEFEFDDFKELLPTLRTEKAETSLIAAFNTHNIFLDNWLIKLFFPDRYEGEEATDDQLLKGMTVYKLFVNYYNNHFIDQESYKQVLWLAAGGKTALFEGMANGDFGVRENNAPWLFSYNEKKHVKSTLPFLPSYPVYLSFDFNRMPVTCTAYQMSPTIGGRNSFVHAIREFKGNIQLQELCARIKAAYPYSILYVTGDASGNRGDVGFDSKNATYYSMIKSYLNLNSRQFYLNKKNLEHHDSRLICNTLLNQYPNFYISKEGCPGLIRDCEIAMVDDKSDKPGKLKKDRELYKMDLFDGFRYFIQTYFKDYVDRVLQMKSK